ncbi:S8 family serine peptidase [Kribbella sp.]|uniref:S8 family serine peptidase n=1 Tax=Kribbella sp. TaxID=1871183 RepID=UPI002D6E9B57|nr:S8 family serine peptidase [Kribbella sp.]HZX08712.1 S8 family serine peptidase [Kribbella sp.]
MFSKRLLRLVVPAAMIAGGVVVVTGSSGSAAEPRLYRPPFAAGKQKAEYDAHSVMVKFKPKATAANRRAAVSRYGAKTDDSVSSNAVELTSDLPAPELLKKVKADPTVELASLNYKRHISAVPNDEYYASDQKAYLNTVRVPQAWDLSKSTGSQIVAVLDTGVDAGHPDLVGHLVPGYNAVSSTRPNPVDDHGHGTMTLGIIAAAANNAIGVAGVGWNVKAMPVKVLDSTGSGYDATIAKGIDWAAAHGAKVINMSLGGPDDNPVLHDAVARAYANGVTIVAAAGNDGDGTVQYPASYPEVISVAATDASGTLTDFSSYGDWVDVAAPGVDILSTGSRALTPPGYEPYWYCTGTSCSAPIVAGIAALVKNKWPAFTPAQVAQRVENLARDAGPRGIDPYYGHGIVDAYAALGGKWAPDFPVAAPDGNDQPARATPISLGTVSGTINTEGETDWYKVSSDAARNLTFSVTGPEFNEDKYLTNIGPRLLVVDSNLTAVAGDVKAYPDFDPKTGLPIWGPLTVSVGAAVQAGDTYIAVRNDNGSRDTRPYTLTVSEATGRSSGVQYTYPVRDVSPADLGVGAPLTSTPTVTFAADMDPALITSDTVFLQNGKTGAVVPGTVAYDATTRRATITPNAPLVEATPYRITVTLGAFAANTRDSGWSSVFSTVDLTPQKLTTFTGSGAYLAANLAWTIPPTPDLDQVIVRRNVGSKAPTPTTGTLVYAGTGTSVKNTGLAQNTTYTYGAWVLDRTGHYSPIAVKQLLGMKSGIATTSTLVNYGGSITIKGSTLRIDNKAYAGLPVNVYVRPKTSSKFTLLAALKTTSTGTLAVVTKPAVSSVYMLTFPGNADLMGTRTADITVQVAPTISAVLSPTAIKLGKSTAISGYVAPAHAGKPVYLQQYGNKVWKSIASVKLSTSGKYAFGIRPATRGKIAYRIWFPADTDHATAYSATKIVTIS